MGTPSECGDGAGFKGDPGKKGQSGLVKGKSKEWGSAKGPDFKGKKGDWTMSKGKGDKGKSLALLKGKGKFMGKKGKGISDEIQKTPVSTES